jgi:hypothetical protein
MDKNLICIMFVVFVGCSSPQEGAQSPVTESIPQEEAKPEPEREAEAKPEPPKPEPPKPKESSESSGEVTPEEIERARQELPRFLPSRGNP